MNRILYNRLTPGEWRKTINISNPTQAEEQQVGLLPNHTANGKIELSMKSIKSRISLGITSSVSKSIAFVDVSFHSVRSTFDKKFETAMTDRPCIIFSFLITVGVLILISNNMHNNSSMGGEQSALGFHGESPVSFVTEIDSKIKTLNTTSLDDVQPIGIALPPAFQYLRDFNSSLREGDIPFYFHIPRSGGATVQDIMGICVGLVLASDAGAGHDGETYLEVYSSPWGLKYLNVDPTTTSGILRAHKLSLVPEGIPGLLASKYPHAGSELFNQNQQGRMITMIRHPVERAWSLFHHEMKETAEKHGSPVNDTLDTGGETFMSIERWARSKKFKDNWMTRHLTNKLSGDLMPMHLEASKEILRRYCLIGLLESKDESIRRFLQYFGLQLNDEKTMECTDRLLHWGWRNKVPHNILQQNSPAHRLLEEINSFDMELYYFAKRLFNHQTNIFTKYIH